MTCPVCGDYEFFCEHAEVIRYAVNQAVGWIAGSAGWDGKPGTFDEWWEANVERFDEDHTLTLLVRACRLLSPQEAAS